MADNELMLKIEHVSKEYNLGTIGGGTLKAEIQSKMARLRHKEDPNLKIGQTVHGKNERFLALDDVNLEIRKGERVGIIGHNGAGKSTLLKLICRVTAPTKGNIYINGRITSMLEVGTGFHAELTGKENVYMNGAILGMTKDEIDAKYDEIVKFSEVEKFIETPIKRYSSGMNIKLGFSIASHLDSEIMIMDEVLAVGDVAFQNKCLARMREVAETEGRTILYVSHNMATIRNLCERVIVLDRGKVIYDGDVETGISTYLGISSEDAVSYNYEGKARVSERSRDVELLSLEMIGKKTNVFEKQDSLNIRLKCRANKTLPSVWFRFEIVNQLDAPVGIAITNKHISVEKDTSFSVELFFSLKNLSVGKYHVHILPFIKTSNGQLEDLDNVQAAAFFKITDHSADKIVWDHQWWGNCHFSDITINKIELL